MNPEVVLKFWFEETPQKMWFTKDEAFDRSLQQRFGALHEKASQGELFSWRETVEGRLAEIILLDQFSRNLFRDSAKAFAQDAVALVLAQEAVRLELDKKLDVNRKAFLYMPYMHSESLLIHEEAIKLFNQPGLEFNFKYEKMHKDIIEKFGRYPHRNALLGRASTSEEEEFLKQPGSSF